MPDVPVTTTSTRARRVLWWEAWLAARIVRSRSRKRRLSSISAISVVGVVIGVAALTVVSGITGGFQDAFRERILGLYPHLIAIKRGGDFVDYREAAARARLAPHVTGASPATYSDMLAAHGERRLGVSVRGIDVDTADDVTRIRDAMDQGSVDALRESLTWRMGAPAGPDGVQPVRLEPTTEGTAWTLVWTAGAQQPLAFRQLPTAPPSLGMSGLRLAHALPATDGPLYLAAGVDMGSSRALAERPGELSRELAVLGPSADIRVERADGTLFAELSLGVRPDSSTWVIATRDAAGRPVLRAVAAATPWDELPVERRPVSVSLVRAFDWRADSAPPLRLQAPPMADSGAPGDQLDVPRSGDASGWLEVPAHPARILLGAALAERLEVRPGDIVTLISPLRGIGGGLGPPGMAPSTARFEVAGWFRSGFWEYDVRLCVVELQAAQRFIHRGDEVQWVDVRFDDDYRVKDFAQGLGRRLQPFGLDDLMRGYTALRQRLGRLLEGDVAGYSFAPPTTGLDWLDSAASATALMSGRGLDFGYIPEFKLIDWEDMNHNLLSALKLQKVVLTIFFLIIIVVAAFNIVGSQVMLVHDKRADIAILKSMGATRGSVTLAFLMQGAALSGVGTALGLVVGLGASYALDAYGFPLDPEVYLIAELPVSVDVWEAFGFGALALVFTVATTLYSARRAGATRPVDGLRRLD